MCRAPLWKRCTKPERNTSARCTLCSGECPVLSGKSYNVLGKKENSRGSNCGYQSTTGCNPIFRRISCCLQTSKSVTTDPLSSAMTPLYTSTRTQLPATQLTQQQQLLQLQCTNNRKMLYSDDTRPSSKSTVLHIFRIQLVQGNMQNNLSNYEKWFLQ